MNTPLPGPFKRGPDRRQRRSSSTELGAITQIERRSGIDRRQFGFISHLDLFAAIPYEAVEKVMALSDLREVKDGEILLSPGEQNKAIHLVVSGNLRIHLERPDSTDFIEVGEGSCFGELSLIDGHPVSAYVVCAGNGRVLTIEQNVFWEQLIPLPGVARNLLRVLSERMRRNDEIIIARLKDKLALESLQKDLSIAKSIQLSMLPPAADLAADTDGIDAHAVMEAAKDVGGDFYDAFSPVPGKLFVAIGDVSGKGIPAALFMARAVTQLRMEAVRRRSPASMLEASNRALCKGNEAGMFVTLFCGLLDAESGAFSYASAGHNPPILIDENGKNSFLPLRPGLVAGIMPDIRYQQGTVLLQPGQSVLLYTDGVTEAMNIQGECYGEQRLKDCIQSLRDATPFDIIRCIHSDLIRFSGNAPRADDITMLVFARIPHAAARPAGELPR